MRLPPSPPLFKRGLAQALFFSFDCSEERTTTSPLPTGKDESIPSPDRIIGVDELILFLPTVWEKRRNWLSFPRR